MASKRNFNWDRNYLTVHVRKRKLNASSHLHINRGPYWMKKTQAKYVSYTCFSLIISRLSLLFVASLSIRHRDEEIKFAWCCFFHAQSPTINWNGRDQSFIELSIQRPFKNKYLKIDVKHMPNRIEFSTNHSQFEMQLTNKCSQFWLF